MAASRLRENSTRHLDTQISLAAAPKTISIFSPPPLLSSYSQAAPQRWSVGGGHDPLSSGRLNPVLSGRAAAPPRCAGFCSPPLLSLLLPPLQLSLFLCCSTEAQKPPLDNTAVGPLPPNLKTASAPTRPPPSHSSRLLLSISWSHPYSLVPFLLANLLLVLKHIPAFFLFHCILHQSLEDCVLRLAFFSRVFFSHLGPHAT